MNPYISSILILFLATAGAAAQDLERVNASDFFDRHAGRIVYIELSDTQVLVFDDAMNLSYTLHGRPLEIRAKNIEVKGSVSVVAFSPDEHAPDTPGQPATAPGQPQAAQGGGTNSPGDGGATGITGTQGAIGKTGDSAAKMRLFFENVAGNGTITFNDAGMKGGKGELGGIGGNGGHGGKGHDRGKCDGSDSPSSGGPGGDGGIGGKGGPGGPGGKSGDIEFGRSLCATSARVRVISPKSEGGDGGNPGMGGANGGAGLGGDGMGCIVGNGGGGSASNIPGTDRSYTPGPGGDPGAKGAVGTVTCEDCQTQPAVNDSGQINCSQ
jgi:hypothetical protein